MKTNDSSDFINREKLSYEIFQLNEECGSRIREIEDKCNSRLDEEIDLHSRRLDDISYDYQKQLETLDQRIEEQGTSQKDKILHEITKRYQERKKTEKKRFESLKKKLNDELNRERKRVSKNYKERIIRIEKILDGNTRSSKNILSNPIFYLIIIFSILGSFFILNSDNDTKEAEIGIKLDKLETRLTVKHVTEDYEINKIPINEFVKGSLGDYYKINLKVPSKKEKILFETGEYFIERDQDELLSSLSSFREAVYDLITENVESQVFIKGTADYLGHHSYKKPLKSPYDLQNGFGEIQYFPKDVEKDVFINQFETYEVGNEITNSDLPMLRAKFMQKIFMDSDRSLKMPIILEGDVSKEIDEQERNAYLILFVDWDKKLISSNQSRSTFLIVGLGLLIIGILFLIFKR